MSIFHEKLKSVIGDVPFTRWAKEHGIDPSTMNEWINNDRVPRSFDKLIKATGKPKEWWLTDSDYAPRNATPVKAINNTTAEYGDKVYVRRYVDVCGSAGPGYDNDVDGLIELVEFNGTVLREYVGVPAQHLVIAGVDGYSMEPHLFHGDQVFIDIRHQTLKNDGVYAILMDGVLRFKRVRINYADKTVLIKSDNDGGLGPETLTQKQTSDLKIIGKVIPFKFGHFKL